MPRVELFCWSNREGCCGHPGEVIECSADDAAYFVNNSAGRLVDEPAKPKPEPIAELEAKPEPAVVEETPVGGNPKRAKK